FAFFLLASCGEEADVLRYSAWQSSPTEERIIRQTLKEFDTHHPEIEYAFQPIPGNYTEKMQLMLGTGKAPDLFWLKGDTAPAYMSFDVLEPLNGYVDVDNTFEIDDIFPVFKKAFEQKGKYYGFAKDFNTYVLFYNKKLFRQTGIPEPPKDWEELYAFSQQLTKDKDGDGKKDQFGFATEPSIDMVLPFAFQNGGDLISEEGKILVGQPEFIEAVRFFMSLYEDGIATIPADQGAGWIGDIFAREQCAMVMSGAWLIPYLEDNAPNVDFGVVELPAGKKRATLAFTNAFVIPKQSTHKDEAWTMLSYLAGPEGMETWTKSGLALPTRKSIAEKNGFYNDSIFKVFMNSIDNAKLYKVDLKERWYDESQAAMQGIFYKKKDIKTTMEALAKTLEKYKLN
ncbi:MAG: extracellular solute-binding protein, partial [Bacteroidota bacterium]